MCPLKLAQRLYAVEWTSDWRCCIRFKRRINMSNIWMFHFNNRIILEEDNIMKETQPISCIHLSNASFGSELAVSDITLNFTHLKHKHYSFSVRVCGNVSTKLSLNPLRVNGISNSDLLLCNTKKQTNTTVQKSRAMCRNILTTNTLAPFLTACYWCSDCR